MADKSGIEWTEATWNPTTGCDRVSPGCDNCYALTLAARLKAMGSARYQRDGDPRTSGPGFGLTVHPAGLDQPLRWTRPRRIFVNSMSDLFHTDVPDEFIASVFAVMAATPRHTYQLLTKRHGRLRSLLNNAEWRSSVFLRESVIPGPPRPLPSWPLPNVWLGVSVEDQKRANLRIPALLDTPAAVRWISAEPMLGPIDLTMIDWAPEYRRGWPGVHNALTGEWWPAVGDAAEEYDGRITDLPKLDWVVAGGESGRGARPMYADWARGLRDQCVAAEVPFFFKQWGEWLPVSTPSGGHLERVGKKAAGRELDGRTWDEYPGGDGRG